LAANPFRYRGYYYDTESGLYYLNSRYYDPATGRFLNEDAISYLAPKTLGGLNLYAYCYNNPVMGYDPDGTIAWFIPLIIVAVAAVIGGTVGAIVVSQQEGATAGKIVKGFFVGFFAGIIISGALIATVGAIATLGGVLWAAGAAALGAAAFNFGILGWGALTNNKTPDPIEFPTTPSYPTLPTTTTGY